MRTKSLLAGMASSILCTSCATPWIASQTHTPLAEVIVANKHAMVKAGDELLFEEFVKYKELRHTFSLYEIASASIEVDTSVSNNSANVMNAHMSLSGGTLGASKTITVNNQLAGKLKIKLTPVGDSPQIYSQIKTVFRHTNGRGYIYDLGYFGRHGHLHGLDGKTLSRKDASADCNADNYCFPLQKDKNGRTEFAYLNNVGDFRALSDKMRRIDPLLAATKNGGITPPPKDKTTQKN